MKYNEIMKMNNAKIMMKNENENSNNNNERKW